MDINDSLLNYILKKSNEIKTESKEKTENSTESGINTLILNRAGIYSFEIKNYYKQIECLSLRDSFIKNISFILNLPNIYYLDLFGNPIENYKPLVKIGTFGFLCISPPLNYFEKQILSLKSLNVVILQAEIKDKGIYNNFLMRNPNILVFNNTIIDFGKKIRTFNAMINFRYYIQNFLIEKDDFPILNNDKNANNNINNINYNNIGSNKMNNFSRSARKSITTDAIMNRDNFLEKRLKIKKKRVINKKCLEIIDFYDDYNKNLFEIFKNNKAHFNQDTLCVEEKKKFLMIYNTFNYIGHFFNNNNYYKLCSKNFQLNINDNSSAVNYPYINIEMFTYLNFLQYKEFVLSILILYLFSILSKGIVHYLILLIFKKTDNYNNDPKTKNLIESDIKSLLDIDKSFLFAFYFKIYDILFEATGKNIDLNKLYDIQDRLKMIIIADKINEILSHQENFIHNYKLNTDLSQKNKIITKDFIRFLFDIKIFHKIFNIIQFVNDFIIYNNLIAKLGHDFPEDMQFFTEVQGLILTNFDKSNEIKESMADKNYNKIQITNLLNNKFFFQNQKFQRTNQNNSIAFYNFQHKTFYPSKKRMYLIDNLKSFNELKKEKEELIKKNYINNALKSFFTVINRNTNNNKENITNLKLNNYLLKNNKHKRNISNQYELTNEKNNNLYKTYSYKKKENTNTIIKDNFNKLEKTINDINKLKILSSPLRGNKNNLKTLNKYTALKRKNLFNNDIISNHLKILDTKYIKNDRNSNCLNMREIINKKNNLLYSYDFNRNNKKNEKEINQYALTINKNSKKLQYSLRIFKKGKYLKNSLKNQNFKLEDIKMDLKELNSISYNPFNLIGRNSFPPK